MARTPDTVPATRPAACRLTVPMRLLHGEPAEDHVYLTFRRTGLLVELLDIPARPVDEEREMVTLSMRDVDALGLGLQAEDFADGVAICHEGAAPQGSAWLCEPVILAGVDGSGEVALILDESDAARWLA